MADVSHGAAELALVLLAVSVVVAAPAETTTATDALTATTDVTAGTILDDSSTVTTLDRAEDPADETTRQSGPVNVTRKSGVEIEFACDIVRVSVPEDTEYSLVVHYFVAETGDYDRGLVGPVEGTVEEPFDAEIVFFEVNVLVGGSVVASGFIPDACPNTPGFALAGSDSLPTTDSSCTSDSSLPGDK
ncbi:hypothetical protein [Halorussus salinisoli]|uniref:hypothetical protein n=1 Tax=Halorussus salinisoli TaxID=2558242 RepID=UPI0010C1E1FA|nr:hypothetical protein [Halorussus salinisoli]